MLERGTEVEEEGLPPVLPRLFQAEVGLVVELAFEPEERGLGEVLHPVQVLHRVQVVHHVTGVVAVGEVVEMAEEMEGEREQAARHYVDALGRVDVGVRGGGVDPRRRERGHADGPRRRAEGEGLVVAAEFGAGDDEGEVPPVCIALENALVDEHHRLDAFEGAKLLAEHHRHLPIERGERLGELRPHARACLPHGLAVGAVEVAGEHPAHLERELGRRLPARHRLLRRARFHSLREIGYRMR